MALSIREADPQGDDALSLLRQAAIEARALYPELHAPNAPWPTNAPASPDGIYLLAYEGATPLACGALRRLDSTAVEIRRMYVVVPARRQGLATQVLGVLERAAGRMGYASMRLETGHRQLPAIALYLRYGFRRIDPFGPFVNDPTSVCFEKRVELTPA